MIILYLTNHLKIIDGLPTFDVFKTYLDKF